MSQNQHSCRFCGEKFSQEEFDQLEFVRGGPAGFVDPKTGEYATTAFEEVRTCSHCGRPEVVRRIDYDPDVDPPTERNPVPTMRPTPGIQ